MLTDNPDLTKSKTPTMPGFEWMRVAGVCGFITAIFLPVPVWLTVVLMVCTVVLVGYSNRLEDKE